MNLSLRRCATGLLAAVTLLAACDSSTAVRYGQINLRLTDAPGDIVKAVVTIDQIYVQAGEDSGAERLVLRDESSTFDLQTLAGSTADLINATVIPVGSYHQLRFVISGAYIEVANEDGGTTIYASSPDYAGLPAGATVGGELQMPSYAQSGLKVNLPGSAIVILENQTVTLIADFDVMQSFGKAAGGSGRWVMSPVINAAEQTPPPIE